MVNRFFYTVGGARIYIMHTLLLVQFNSSLASRTFMDFDSLPEAMEGVCALFEKELKLLNPNQANITYDIADLFAYVDQLADISAMIYQEPIKAYLPRNRDWVKKQLVNDLREKAS